MYYQDVDDLGNKTHVQVHRAVMEEHLGRPLLGDEVVHHKNHVKTDNRLENLEVMQWDEHSISHAKPQTILEFTCEECGCLFDRRKGQDPSAKGNTRVFCSKPCSARFYAKKRRGRRGTKDLPHGTKQGYSYHKCRCDLCKEANRAAQARYRRSKLVGA